MKTVRFFLERRGDPDYIGYAITVIAHVDEENRLQTRFHTGFMGSLTKDSQRLYPFVLRNDGTIDFGFDGDYEETAKLNLFGRNLSVGDPVSYQADDEEEEIYKITAIDLISGVSP